MCAFPKEYIDTDPRILPQKVFNSWHVEYVPPMENSAQASPEVVMFIRHGEKPSDQGIPHGVDEHGRQNPHSLSVRGWTRAGGLAALFSHAPTSPSTSQIVNPQRIYATQASVEAKSQREVDTAKPTADLLKLKINDSHPHGHPHKVAEELLAEPTNPLVVWHHGEIPAIVAHFSIENINDVPATWPEDRFDIVWILTRGSNGSYKFSVMPQMLLVDDRPV
jgi:hypothetical protein